MAHTGMLESLSGRTIPSNVTAGGINRPTGYALSRDEEGIVAGALVVRSRSSYGDWAIPG